MKLRYANFKTVTRSHTEDPPTRDTEEIAVRALALLEKTEAGRTPVRLLGVSVHGLNGEDGAETAEGGVSEVADAPQLDLPVK